MATNEELKQRVAELEQENNELLDENEQLQADLAKALQNQKATAPQVPNEPSFKFSEGERQDLEMTGRSVSPFTGKVTTAKAE